MANTDSFIDEVNEEVRRDRLFAFFRKWAWLAILVVALVVGGAAWFEYQRTQRTAAAQAFGDSLIATLEQAEPEARVSALEAITPPTPEGAVLLALLAAGEVAEADDREAAAARLREAAEGAELAPRYRDLALLKAHLLHPEPDQARLVLGALAEPGAPYSALAEEQLALLDIAEGDLEAGVDRLRRLQTAASATPGLQQRAEQLVVALESGAALVDTSPDAVDNPQDDPQGAVAPESDAGALDLLPPVSEGAAEDRSDAEDSSDAEDASPTAGEDDAADTTEPAAEPAAEE
ncbi:MAG: hypothetical protein HLUCCO18_14490 [Rhodobacteraceae bacterium HLUCCO18]|nr:MAG: hypothetical protein HLUCCO18_14490 [Rhodobacteraceae bacterium HLUCCO18]